LYRVRGGDAGANRMLSMVLSLIMQLYLPQS
jgi:hypothetical protein